MPLQATEMLPEPVIVDQVLVKANKPLVGKHFKKEAASEWKGVGRRRLTKTDPSSPLLSDVLEHFEQMSNADAEALEAGLKVRSYGMCSMARTH